MRSLIGQIFRYAPGYSWKYSIPNPEMIRAICLGHVRTWWDGKTFFIEEFFIRTREQNSGIGSHFIKEIETILSREDRRNRDVSMLDWQSSAFSSHVADELDPNGVYSHLAENIFSKE